MNFSKLFLLFLSFYLFFETPALAKNSAIDEKEIQSLIAEEKKELDILKKKLARQNAKLSSVHDKEVSLLKTLGQMEDRLKLRERELEIYKWNNEINKRKISKLETLIKNTEETIQEQKKALSKWLRIVYKEGKEYPVRVLFSSKNISDLLQRIKYMQLVAEYDTSLFKSYESKLNNLLNDKNALLQVRSNLMLLKKDAELKKKEVFEERDKKKPPLPAFDTARQESTRAETADTPTARNTTTRR